MVDASIFNEKNLQTDIASMWGENGAHIEVFDSMVKEIERLRSLSIMPVKDNKA